MKPSEFPEQTIVLQKPPDMTDEQCGTLAIHQTQDGQCISRWRGTWRDRLRFLFGGDLWLWVHSGRTQPPVYIGTEHPFQQQS